jgi:hypothetical protein
MSKNNAETELAPADTSIEEDSAAEETDEETLTVLRQYAAKSKTPAKGMAGLVGPSQIDSDAEDKIGTNVNSAGEFFEVNTCTC